MDAWRYRYLTTQQVTRLHFTHLKIAQRRLRILHQRDLLDRFRPSHAFGQRRWWYRLSRAGARIVAQEQGFPAAALVPPRRVPRSPAFLQHHAVTTDVRIWLHEGCATRGFGYQFVPAYEEVRRNGTRHRRLALTVPGHARVLIPDGAALLSHGTTKALFLIEVDQGTEPLTGRHTSAIAHKLIRYREAYDTGTAETHYGCLFATTLRGFRVLCIVPDATRERGFIRLARDLDFTPLVWVATRDRLTQPGNLDEKCWLVEHDQARRRLTE